MKHPVFPDALLHAADTFGTPTYVYVESVIRDRCRQLSGHLADLPVALYYAMKANSNPAVLQVVLEEGLNLEAVSPGEVALALRMGLPPDQVLFTSNNMTDAEMHEVQGTGVLFNIGELSRLEKYGLAYPGSRVCVRLNPRIGAGHHRHVVTAGKLTKFGIALTDVPDVLACADRHGLRIVGLHQHIGSGVSTTAQFQDAMLVLLDQAHGFPDLAFLNFGGGINIPYRANERAFDFDRFEKNIVEPLRHFLESRDRPFHFWFEPGRFFVAEAGALLTRVNTLKHSDGRTFAGVDSGFNHLIRPILYDSYHEIYNLSNPDGPFNPYDITGNICESGDLFARDRAIQEIREGDVLALLDTGAYGMVMASDYNLRARPAEVMLRPDGTLDLARPRLDTRALVDQYLAQTIGNAAWNPVR